ncbi:uncharacterized protein ALTATR162_LOCUS4586 [Alternaria atra]|uniref:Uncharacterized protein n=1 Tax=Alternaria atra TaxID=119953 RepID=A0A8J2I0W5_9PLEO|nr:uncharacterized protein ALTATR162_LOCUS4586 [Alternaria atra]CAG5156793.1 unnamed protein product [Alternaria atra]
MSQPYEFGKQDSVSGDGLTDALGMNGKARQRSSNHSSQFGESDEPTSPNPLGEHADADATHGREKEQNEETQSGSIVKEPIYEGEQNTSRPSLQSNVSSFAAPTKASEAKKNEKIELASFVKKIYSTNELAIRSNNAMRQHSVSVLDNQRSSLKQRSVTTSTHIREEENAVDHSPPYMKLQSKNMRCHSLASTISDRSAGEEGIQGEVEKPPSLEKELLEEELPDEQAQEEEVQEEEEPCMQEQKELEEVEEPSTEFQEPQEQKSPLAKDIMAWTSQGGRVTDLEEQVATTQGQIESESRNGTEADEKCSVVISTDIDDIALGKTTADMEELEAGLEDAKRQRDEVMMRCETVQRDLQTVKDDAEKLQQKHNKLIVQLQHSEELIAARNVREPNLPALEAVEAVEAENKRLQVAVGKTRLELNNANACCENLDDQLRDAQEKLNNQETSIKELCEIIDLVSQSMSQGVDIPVPQSEELSQSLVQASEIERLRIKIAQLIGGYGKDFKNWHEKNEELERQIADQESEISRLEKTMDIQRRELLSPGLQSPMFPQAMQMDRDEFQQYYERERLKRKGAEQELAKAKKLLSHIHPENEKLQSDLTNAQEELADLRPRAEKLEQDVKGWKQDSEEKNLQLEERTRAFEASTDQQKQETLRYIKDYYNKTKDETHWEVQGLQKKLAALDEERVGLKRAFKQAKMDIARLGDCVTRLRKRNKARDAHIGNVQQAFMCGEEFPTLESDDDTSSSTSASTISSLTHPLDRVNRPPSIPRCHLPTTIGARNAVIATYHQELEELREQELFNVIVKPPVSTKNKNGAAYNEIMERVREWKMGSSYSPRKLGWGELRRKSPWERWDGEMWAKEFATGKDVDVLKERGLWHET